MQKEVIFLQVAMIASSDNILKPIRDFLGKVPYTIYEKPYQLNIVGVRTDNRKPNSFDDTMHVFWKNDANAWELKSYVITTDAGLFYLQKPMNPNGTAILKPGQYKNSYMIGIHRTYEALVQCKPVCVIRDANKDAVLDFNKGKEEIGYFGINIHRATASGKSKLVDKWSAGCQVFADSANFAEFMDLAKKHRKLYGNMFTYTLINQIDLIA